LSETRPVLRLEHSDSRGEIYSITLPDGRELMLLHSKEGSIRGGHAHDVNETILVLNGAMRYYKVPGGTEAVTMLMDGDVSFNTAGEPHMGEFLQDTWLVEWKIGVKPGEWKNIDHDDYRKLVTANIERAD
jgi:quercetin dioxygenase-like cupin family protein